MSLARKLEQAMLAALTTAGVTVPIRLGQTDDEQVFPVVIIRTAQAQEEPFDSGNYRMTVDVAVRHTVDDDPGGVTDAAANLDALIAQVQEVVHSVTLADDLNAAGVADFTCIGAGQRIDLEVDYEGRFFEAVRQVEVYCCESDLIGV